MRNLTAGVLALCATAALFIAGGLYAYSAAPPEANATTALIIPSASALVLLSIAAAVWRWQAVPAGRRLLVGGGVACMLFALLFLFPAMARQKQLRNYPAALEAWNASPLAADTTVTRDARRAFFRELKSPDHDTTYLVATLFTLKAIAWLGGIVSLSIARRARRAVPA